MVSISVAVFTCEAMATPAVTAAVAERAMAAAMAAVMPKSLFRWDKVRRGNSSGSASTGIGTKVGILTIFPFTTKLAQSYIKTMHQYKHNLKFPNTTVHVLGTQAVTDTLSTVPLTEVASHSHTFIQNKFPLATIV